MDIHHNNFQLVTIVYVTNMMLILACEHCMPTICLVHRGVFVHYIFHRPLLMDYFQEFLNKQNNQP